MLQPVINDPGINFKSGINLNEGYYGESGLDIGLSVKSPAMTSMTNQYIVCPTKNFVLELFRN